MKNVNSKSPSLKYVLERQDDGSWAVVCLVPTRSKNGRIVERQYGAKIYTRTFVESINTCLILNGEAPLEDTQIIEVA